MQEGMTLHRRGAEDWAQETMRHSISSQVFSSQVFSSQVFSSHKGICGVGTSVGTGKRSSTAAMDRLLCLVGVALTAY